MNILITGASQGLGFETAVRLFKDSGNVIIAIARSEKNLQMLKHRCGEINSTSHIIIKSFDLESDESAFIKDLFPFLQKNVNHIDVLINNAGALLNKPFVDTDKKDWENIFNINFFASVKLIKTSLPLLEKSLNPAIVNIGSMGGFQGNKKFIGLSAYCASKGALATLTECLAEEFKEKNISVNCLCLGSIHTKMFKKAFGDRQASFTVLEMSQFVRDFAIHGSAIFNGKVLPIAKATP